jgi:predicted phosphodiesterase
MATLGLIADIHGNREALAAVLAQLARRGAERIVCLGDIVGYNADPELCVRMLRQRAAAAVAGNHDLIAVGAGDFSRCSNKARYALERTRRRLSTASRAYLARLPRALALEGGIVLVHAGVRDVGQYLRTCAHIEQNARLLAQDFPAARLCLFGHSHEQKVYEVHGGIARELPLAPRLQLRRDRLYFINPGAVDAARKRSPPLAEFGVLDTEAWQLELERVPYDAAAAEARAAARGYRIPGWVDWWYSLRRQALRACSKALGTGSLP